MDDVWHLISHLPGWNGVAQVLGHLGHLGQLRHLGHGVL